MSVYLVLNLKCNIIQKIRVTEKYIIILCENINCHKYIETLTQDGISTWNDIHYTLHVMYKRYYSVGIR